MLSDTEKHTIIHQKLGAYNHEDGSLPIVPLSLVTHHQHHHLLVQSLYNYGCLSPNFTHPHTFPYLPSSDGCSSLCSYASSACLSQPKGYYVFVPLSPTFIWTGLPFHGSIT
ncbi:hypothetical protein BKA60DRAFT_74659 [Fusarium oxysporum]|nr:hypothetical protein BKA60DRAFT_74659 [Fusarium oxysporum]